MMRSRFGQFPEMGCSIKWVKMTHAMTLQQYWKFCWANTEWQVTLITSIVLYRTSLQLHSALPLPGSTVNTPHGHWFASCQSAASNLLFNRSNPKDFLPIGKWVQCESALRAFIVGDIPFSFPLNFQATILAYRLSVYVNDCIQLRE